MFIELKALPRSYCSTIQQVEDILEVTVQFLDDVYAQANKGRGGNGILEQGRCHRSVKALWEWWTHL
jgi:hypothetical protein